LAAGSLPIASNGSCFAQLGSSQKIRPFDAEGQDEGDGLQTDPA
jgi:hypothetical protein